MLAIEVLQTEQELAEEFLASLRARYLPEKFFYWMPLSVKAWLDLCQEQQPYKNYSRSLQLITQHAGAIAGEWATQNPGREVELVSLGAGQGDKDLTLLQALREKLGGAGRFGVRYRPVDSSQALLELAVQSAAAQGFHATGLKADVASEKLTRDLKADGPHPRPAGAQGPAGRIYLVLGNSLGVIDPLLFLKTLREFLQPQDFVLLDGEIYSSGQTMAGYDNPVNRRFAFAPLASIGLEEGRDGTLVFENGSDPRMDGLHWVGKHFQAARDLEIRVAGTKIVMASGERMAMNSSYKYSRQAFLRIVERDAGLRLLREYVSEDAGFEMVLAVPERNKEAGT